MKAGTFDDEKFLTILYKTIPFVGEPVKKALTENPLGSKTPGTSLVPSQSGLETMTFIALGKKGLRLGRSQARDRPGLQGTVSLAWVKKSAG